MAIQINERDQLIFKLIEEHQVLLEKHIAWFISKDGKPVLIRDRLRKLFYLDYLLCGRHPEVLPWWTTPTKPLVYTLSPLARHTIGGSEPALDLSDSRVQRHFLELANLRMLFLMAWKDGSINSVEWTTVTQGIAGYESGLQAKVSFIAGNQLRQIGIINSPFIDVRSELVPQLKSALSLLDVKQIWIICRDNIHKAQLQEGVAREPSLCRNVLFATHSDLYNLGAIGSPWQTADRCNVSILETIAGSGHAWPVGFTVPNTATA